MPIETSNIYLTPTKSYLLLKGEVDVNQQCITLHVWWNSYGVELNRIG